MVKDFANHNGTRRHDLWQRLWLALETGMQRQWQKVGTYRVWRGM